MIILVVTPPKPQNLVSKKRTNPLCPDSPNWQSFSASFILIKKSDKI
jgi:hypothetical protein